VKTYDGMTMTKHSRITQTTLVSAAIAMAQSGKFSRRNFP